MPVGILNVSAGELRLTGISLRKVVGLDVQSIEVAGPQPQAITAVAVMGYPPDSEPLGLRVPGLFEQHPITPVDGVRIPPARSPYDVDSPVTLPGGELSDPPNKASVILRVGLPAGVSMGWYVGVDLTYTGPTGEHVAHFGEVFGGVCRTEHTPPLEDEVCNAVDTADDWRRSHPE